MSRYKDAETIQVHGASNPSGVALALVEAIKEAKAEGVNPRQDFACQAICHQLGWILNVAAFEDGYLKCMDTIHERVEKEAGGEGNEGAAAGDPAEVQAEPGRE